MELKVYQTDEQWTRAINHWCVHNSYSASSMFLPSGETPKPLYKDWSSNRPEWLSKIRLVQLDEVIAQNDPYRSFFESELPNEKVSWVSERPAPADLAILGLGWNGHVAFHEPHMPHNFSFGEVELSPGTCERNRVPVGSKGLSFGLGAFLTAKHVLMIVRGAGKKEVLGRLLDADETLPASALLAHRNFTIITSTDSLR